MPTVQITLAESSESISRPIVFSVIDQLKNITNIPSTVKVLFPGDLNKVKQAGAGLNEERQAAILSSSQYMHIEVDENYLTENVNQVIVYDHEQSLIFNDKEIGLRIKPAYATMGVNITLRYQCVSKTMAFKWRDDMKAHISQQRDINLHDLEYHYLMPDEYMYLIRSVYALKQNKFPNSQDFKGYFMSNITGRARVVSDLAGLDKRVAITERQTRVVGMFGFDSSPDKPTYDEATASWNISLAYKFTYEKPISVVMKYPVMVYNQLLDLKYLTFFANTNHTPSDDVNKRYTTSMGALNSFESGPSIKRLINNSSRLNLPDYDDFITDNNPKLMAPIVTFLIEVDETNLTSMLNLKETGDVVIDPDILDFIIQSEYQHITKMYQSVFYLTMYVGDRLTDSNSLICDRDLNVSAKVPVDLKKIHHVSLFICVDLTVINSSFFSRLMNFPKAAVKIINSINESLNGHPAIKAACSKSEVSIDDMNEVYRYITGSNVSLKYTPRPAVYIQKDPNGRLMPLSESGLQQVMPNAIQHTPYNGVVDGSGDQPIIRPNYQTTRIIDGIVVPVMPEYEKVYLPSKNFTVMDKQSYTECLRNAKRTTTVAVSEILTLRHK
jgi:hypothetical protein